MAHQKSEQEKLLGEYLKAKREEKHYSQQYVADQMGVSKMAISNWESGNRSIYATSLIKYCLVIDLNPNDIVSDIDFKK